MDTRFNVDQSLRRVAVLFFCLALSLLVPASTFAQDASVKITNQPLPDVPAGAATLDVEGKVLLLVEFLADGVIGKVSVVSSMPAGLTEYAVAAAKRIEFKPGLRGGKAVDFRGVVGYSYTWKRAKWNALPLIGENEFADTAAIADDPKAVEVVNRAVAALGGDSYLNAKTQVGRGKYSEINKEGVVLSFRSFLDVIAFPDKERTEFKGQGTKSIQVNTGSTGWIFDGSMDVLRDQGEAQVANFKKSIRTSLDNLLRGGWRGEARLAFVGRRAGSLGKRNDVVKLTYNDGLVVEFEFTADEGLPVRAFYKRINDEGEDILEEDRYAQFVESSGIKSPFIVDHLTNGKITSRINYESIEHNRPIPDSVFAKPANAKQVKELKL